jgi:DNA (cytosine-5)-methyltransferase 1
MPKDCKSRIDYDDVPSDELTSSNGNFRAMNWSRHVRLKEMPTSPARKKLKVIDLFCGCGGLTLGTLIACNELGLSLEVVLAADNWSDALKVYNKNFSSISRQISLEDLSSLVAEVGSLDLSSKGKTLVKEMGEVDLIIAGPPCQGNSDLNNSSRRDDPRNKLYTIPVAIGLEVKAKFIVIENVPPVVHSSGNVVNDSVRALRQAGYGVTDIVASALNYGIAQTRRRHIIFASKNHSDSELAAALKALPQTSEALPVWEFISDLEFEMHSSNSLLTKQTKMSEENVRRVAYLFDNDIYELPNSLRPACHRDKSHSYVSMYGRMRKDTPAQTITSGFGSMGQGRYVHPTQRRLITAHEAARIQGFPDYFTFEDVTSITALRTIIANAVPPPLIASLLPAILG